MPDQGHKRTIYEHIQVMETHARQLERELADMTKQRDALAEALRNYMSHHRRYGFVTLNEVLDAEQALRATKGGSYDS
jgi:hypothetical protein